MTHALLLVVFCNECRRAELITGKQGEHEDDCLEMMKMMKLLLHNPDIHTQTYKGYKIKKIKMTNTLLSSCSVALRAGFL